MKAAVLRAFGAPLEPAELPVPEPGPGDVLIRVAACGVCHSDLHVARGEWEAFKPRIRMPLVLGHEVAGRIAALGPGVTGLREGDAVGVPWFHSTCGTCHYCRRDLEVFCDAAEITGVTVPGGFAEYLLARATHTVPIPAALDLAAAAPLFCAGGTVWSALAKVELGPGSHLAVWGTGGLGHYAVQLGKRAGARVTAVDPATEQRALALRLGADAALDPEGAAAALRAPEQRVDVALVTAASIRAYEGAYRSLGRTGTLLVVGIPSEPLGLTAASLIRSGVRVVPSRVASRRELRELLEVAGRGEVRTELRRYRLGEVNAALETVAAGSRAGRAVLDFEGSE